MKIKKDIYILLIALLIFLFINIKSYAITAPSPMITSNNYAVGDKMKYSDVKEIGVGKTLQLYAVIAHGNEMLVDNDYSSLGWFVDEAKLNGVTWTSSDNSIATVDNTGKVTGLAEGKVDIIANYDGDSVTYELNVKRITTKNIIMIIIGGIIGILLISIIIYKKSK